MNTRNPWTQNIDQEIVFVVIVVTSYKLPMWLCHTIDYQFLWYIHHSRREKKLPFKHAI